MTPIALALLLFAVLALVVAFVVPAPILSRIVTALAAVLLGLVAFGVLP